jgi:hypothetical protein
MKPSTSTALVIPGRGAVLVVVREYRALVEWCLCNSYQKKALKNIFFVV